MSKSRTGAQHNFSRIEGPEIQRSSFNRSCGLKTTFDADLLIPVFVEEAVPGDTMNLKMHNFARLATPLHPILDNMYLDSFFFSIPMRLVWDNWEKFNGSQDNPDDSTDFVIPEVSLAPADVTPESLWDYLGIPTQITGTLRPSALYSRAYNLIWNEWFRSEAIQDSVLVQTGDGPDVAADTVLLPRGKRHDYFTSCNPWPQKGDSVALPLGQFAPVVSDGSQMLFDTSSETGFGLVTDDGGNLNVTPNPTGGADDPLLFGDQGLQADLSDATAATINQLRQAFQVQRLLERDARGGTRYVEMIKAHFGVVSPDFRLQRPEYLGGGTQTINVTPVPQTSETDLNTPQGNLAAYGTSSGSNHSFVKSFDEHCIVIGLVSLRADLNYQQGLLRQFSRKTRFDFYLPVLAHLGEQAVLQQEIYCQGFTSPDTTVFGYQERWAEMRYKPSMITGKMRSNDPQSLDTWHLAQDFSTPPVLGPDFIRENVPVDRIIAVQDEPHILFDAFFEFTHARPMPTFSTPGQIDHF